MGIDRRIGGVITLSRQRIMESLQKKTLNEDVSKSDLHSMTSKYQTKAHVNIHTGN